MAVTPYPTLQATVIDGTTVDASTDTNGAINAMKNGPQGLVVAPATLTANSATVTTVETDSGLTATTPTIPANRWLKITVDLFAGSSVATDSVDIYLTKDGSDVDHGVALCVGAVRFGLVYWDQPSNAAHTYKVRFKRNAGTGNVYIYGGTVSSGVEPWLSIEDVGAA